MSLYFLNNNKNFLTLDNGYVEKELQIISHHFKKPVPFVHQGIQALFLLKNSSGMHRT